MDVALAYEAPALNPFTKRVIDALKSRLDYGALRYTVESIPWQNGVVGDTITLGDRIALINGSSMLGTVEVGWSPYANCICFLAPSRKSLGTVSGLRGYMHLLEVTQPFSNFVSHIRRAFVSTYYAAPGTPKLVI